MDRLRAWDGFSTFADDMTVSIEDGWLMDSSGNTAGAVTPADGGAAFTLVASEVGTPSIPEARIKSIYTTHDGHFKEGDIVKIFVVFDQKIDVDSSGGATTITLNNGGTANLVTSDGRTSLLEYHYTVGAGEDVSELDLQQTDAFGSSATSTFSTDFGLAQVHSSNPPVGNAQGSLVSNNTLNIDTTEPQATIASANYDPDSNQLELSGTNFNDILSANTPAQSTELRLVLDWSKLSYQVNGLLTESFSEEDVLSARVVDNTRLIIELAAAKADSIEANTGGDYSNDELNIAAGFIRDLAGNVATTDALSSGSISQLGLKVPDLTSSLASDNELVLGFSETLSGSPSTSDFSVQIDGGARLVTNVSVSGQEVTVTFDGAQIDSSGQLLFSYTGNSLSSSNGAIVTKISDKMAGLSHGSQNALDALIGDIGDDIFSIDHEDVTATGGIGADTFDFNASGTAQNPAELIITDFSTDEGDMLKLDDVLVSAGDSLDQHFHFVTSGNDTVMEISDTANGAVTKKVTFKDVDLFALGNSDADILNQLMNNNNLDHGESS